MRTLTEILGEFPPGVIPPDEPIYVLPPEEQQPEISVRADKLAESRDWSHANLAVQPLFDRGIRGEGVVVAICDSGVDYEHLDLIDNIVREGNRDFTGSPSGFKDLNGHGTHCAGIAAAGANGNGLIGIAPLAKILVVKVLNDQGSGASRWIANGIRHAADNGADIISLSLGGPSPDNLTRSAIQYAVSRGCWVTCAGGNDSGPAENFPGHYPESVAVAATDRNDRRASFSTINRENDIAAPGVSIMSTLPKNRYGSMSGTSMSCPGVAGCLALVRGELKRTNRTMPTQTKLIEALVQTAKDIAPPGPDSSTGSGLIDVQALLNLLVPVGPIDPPPQPPGDRVWSIRGTARLNALGQLTTELQTTPVA